MCADCREAKNKADLAKCSVQPEQVQVGKTFRGKQYREFLTANNDRYVIWVSPMRDKVQYDSDTVRMGRHYPTVTMLAFCKWAREEVTPKKEAAK